MSGIGKLGPIFLAGVLAGYLACRLLPRGWLGVVLACMLSSLAIVVVVFFFYPAKLQAHFVIVNANSLFSWFAMCSVPGLFGYAGRRWYEPWIDTLRKQDSEQSRNRDKVDLLRNKLKALNARRISRAMSRNKAP
jgi:hypothetical protein